MIPDEGEQTTCGGCGRVVFRYLVDPRSTVSWAVAIVDDVTTHPGWGDVRLVDTEDGQTLALLDRDGGDLVSHRCPEKTRRCHGCGTPVVFLTRTPDGTRRRYVVVDALPNVDGILGVDPVTGHVTANVDRLALRYRLHPARCLRGSKPGAVT
ncbi:hypothetical protein [Streptomyces sp. B1-3]|uniref:hypothetical protein n=1 Tax=Streptomyces sp. B1-3 TaxID=3141453 RepID=UPI003D2659BA